MRNASPHNPPRWYKALVILLGGLPLVTIIFTVATFIHIQKQDSQPSQVAKLSHFTVSALPVSTPIASSTDAPIKTSSYQGKKSQKSNIQKNETAKLYLIKNSLIHKTFVTAASNSIDLNTYTFTKDWTVREVGNDAMWIPGACAQKPSWLFQNKYVVIQDGKYSVQEKSENFVVYNTESQEFTTFGGSLLTTDQALENIMHIQVENDKLVFYVDHHDARGTFASSASFKHSTSYTDHYFIRRVISISDLTYDDYRISYDMPTFSPYTLRIGTIDSTQPTTDLRITVTSEGYTKSQEGYVKGTQTIHLEQIDLSTSNNYQPAKTTSGTNTIIDPIRQKYSAAIDTLYIKVTSDFPTFATNYHASYNPNTPFNKDDIIVLNGKNGLVLDLETGAPLAGPPVAYNEDPSVMSPFISINHADTWMKDWVSMTPFIMGEFNS